jgi:hypothetical protein
MKKMLPKNPHSPMAITKKRKCLEAGMWDCLLVHRMMRISAQRATIARNVPCKAVRYCNNVILSINEYYNPLALKKLSFIPTESRKSMEGENSLVQW